jgi:hypothetical protein
MRANVMPGPRSDALKGLNWHVQVDPLTLSMTSLPPTLLVLAVVLEVAVVLDVAVVLELFDPPPPHALSVTHTATHNVIHVMRFIATLSFPVGERRPVAGEYLGNP